MAGSFSVNIDGIAAVSDRLKALGGDYQKKGLKFAGRKAANLIRDRAQKNVSQYDDPKTPTNIAKNIAVRFSNSTLRRTGNIKYRIGVLGGAKAPSKIKKASRASDKYLKPRGANPGGETYYWRHLEFGTRNHAAKPFLRPAAENNQQEVFDEFGKHLEKWTDRAVKKLAKGQ